MSDPKQTVVPDLMTVLYEYGDIYAIGHPLPRGRVYLLHFDGDLLIDKMVLDSCKIVDGRLIESPCVNVIGETKQMTDDYMARCAGNIMKAQKQGAK